MKRTQTFVFFLIAAGCLMVLAALFISNRALEQALLGDLSKSLGWGATLFRGLLAAHGLALVLGTIVWRRSRRATTGSQSAASHQITENSHWMGRQALVVMTILTVVALGLRLWHLNSDLWYDELISLLDFFRPSFGTIITSFSSQNQHMLYSILAHGSISLFGESAWAIRLPSVAFGVGSIWALFLLGRKLIGVRESLFACAIMTVSYHHIWFSQNARGYMALLFFTILATWLLVEALARDSWKFWMGYTAAISLGVWSHMTMAFVFAAHGLLYIALIMLPGLIRNRRQSNTSKSATVDSQLSWKPLIAALLSLSLTLQLHALALPDFLGSALQMPSLPSEWSSPLWVIVESLRSLRVGLSGTVAVVAGTALFAVGWWSIQKRNTLAAMAMILPALMGGATMLVLDHYLWPRFFFFSMGFALLIAVHGAMVVPQLVIRHIVKWKSRESWGSISGLALASLMIAASAITVPLNYKHPKQDYTGAREYVESHRAPSDAVVAVGLAATAYRRYFAPQWSVAQTHEELDAVRRDKAKVWLVYTLPIEVKAFRPEVWQAIQTDFEVVKVFPGTLGGGDIFVCRERSSKDDKFSTRIAAKSSD